MKWDLFALVWLSLGTGVVILAWKDTPYWQSDGYYPLLYIILYWCFLFAAVVCLLIPELEYSSVTLSAFFSRHMTAFLTVASYYLATFGSNAITMNQETTKEGLTYNEYLHDCKYIHPDPTVWLSDLAYFIFIAGCFATIGCVIAPVGNRPCDPDKKWDADEIRDWDFENFLIIGAHIPSLCFPVISIFTGFGYYWMHFYKRNNISVVPSALSMAFVVWSVLLVLVVVLVCSLKLYEPQDKEEEDDTSIGSEVCLILAFWAVVFANPRWAIAVPGRVCDNNPHTINSTGDIVYLLVFLIGGCMLVSVRTLYKKATSLPFKTQGDDEQKTLLQFHL